MITDVAVAEAARTAPLSMLAMIVRRFGGPEVLEPVRLPVPQPVADQVLVRNAFIGVNYVDLQHRAGTPYPVSLPLVPGTEAAGTVVAVGPLAAPELVGSRVVHFGHLDGVYAEHTAVSAAHVVQLPDRADLAEAAATALVGTTAHVLTRIAAEVAGRTVVVHSAAGSTGGAVVQLAAARGATVIGIVSARGRAAAAFGLGADEVVVAEDTEDLAAAVDDLTGGRGADLVYDAAGRPTFRASLRMLAAGGRLMLYGAAVGHPDPIAPADLSGLAGANGLRGSLGLAWVAASDYLVGTARAAAIDRVREDLAAGRLSSRVVEVLDLADAAEAHRRLASRRVDGKLLLRVP